MAERAYTAAIAIVGSLLDPERGSMMNLAPNVPSSSPTLPLPSTEESVAYQEGIVAGVLAAVAVAVWFFVVDTLQGRPLFTPTVLGTALFRHGSGLSSPGTMPVSLEMVLMFTWVHGLAFAAIGGVIAYLLRVAERHPGVGFGILLLFVVLQSGFLAAALLLAAPILHAVAWWAILVANLLAAATMALYFRRRHPGLIVEP